MSSGARRDLDSPQNDKAPETASSSSSSSSSSTSTFTNDENDRKPKPVAVELEGHSSDDAEARTNRKVNHYRKKKRRTHDDSDRLDPPRATQFVPTPVGAIPPAATIATLNYPPPPQVAISPFMAGPQGPQHFSTPSVIFMQPHMLSALTSTGNPTLLSLGLPGAALMPGLAATSHQTAAAQMSSIFQLAPNLMSATASPLLFSPQAVASLNLQANVFRTGAGFPAAPVAISAAAAAALRRGSGGGAGDAVPTALLANHPVLNATAATTGNGGASSGAFSSIDGAATEAPSVLPGSTALRRSHPSLYPPAERTATGRPAVTLFMECDSDSLSPYQCVVRKQIELFEATKQDVETNAQGRNRPIVMGQVGIRCRHCTMLPPKDRARGAVYYPARLAGLYQAAQNMAVSHLADHCHHVPEDVREELRKLRERKSSAGGGKKYWAEGVRALGVLEDQDGLRFEPR